MISAKLAKKQTELIVAEKTEKDYERFADGNEALMFYISDSILKAIGKGKYNTIIFNEGHTKGMYETIAKNYDIFKPLMEKHGYTVNWYKNSYDKDFPASQFSVGWHNPE